MVEIGVIALERSVTVCGNVVCGYNLGLRIGVCTVRSLSRTYIFIQYHVGLANMLCC